jgi:hypothetical protein
MLLHMLSKVAASVGILVIAVLIASLGQSWLLLLLLLCQYKSTATPHAGACSIRTSPATTSDLPLTRTLPHIRSSSTFFFPSTTSWTTSRTSVKVLKGVYLMFFLSQ